MLKLNYEELSTFQKAITNLGLTPKNNIVYLCSRLPKCVQFHMNMREFPHIEFSKYTNDGFLVSLKVPQQRLSGSIVKQPSFFSAKSYINQSFEFDYPSTLMTKKNTSIQCVHGIVFHRSSHIKEIAYKIFSVQFKDIKLLESSVSELLNYDLK